MGQVGYIGRCELEIKSWCNLAFKKTDNFVTVI